MITIKKYNTTLRHIYGTHIHVSTHSMILASMILSQIVNRNHNHRILIPLLHQQSAWKPTYGSARPTNCRCALFHSIPTIATSS